MAQIQVGKRKQPGREKQAAESMWLTSAMIAAEEEAARQVANELHDEIVQKLAVLSMEIGVAAGDSATPRAVTAQLRKFQDVIVEIGENIRHISHQMHPAILDDLGLAAALQSICCEFERAQKIPCRIRCGVLPDEIDRATALCLYRVARESLRNVARHAKARDVNVSLKWDGSMLELMVGDSGLGFDPAQVHGGLGRHSMRERVRFVDGTLSIVSAPGHGTTVIARVPPKQDKSSPKS